MTINDAVVNWLLESSLEKEPLDAKASLEWEWFHQSQLNPHELHTGCSHSAACLLEQLCVPWAKPCCKGVKRHCSARLRQSRSSMPLSVLPLDLLVSLCIGGCRMCPPAHPACCWYLCPRAQEGKHWLTLPLWVSHQEKPAQGRFKDTKEQTVLFFLKEVVMPALAEPPRCTLLCRLTVTAAYMGSGVQHLPARGDSL